MSYISIAIAVAGKVILSVSMAATSTELIRYVRIRSWTIFRLIMVKRNSFQTKVLLMRKDSLRCNFLWNVVLLLCLNLKAIVNLLLKLIYRIFVHRCAKIATIDPFTLS